MRRAIAAVVATVAGLALLLSYKTSPTSPATTRSAPATPAAAVTTGPPPPDTVGQPRSSLPRRSPTSTTSTLIGRASGRFSGPVESTRYGPVQVSVTLANGTLTDVRADQLPSDRRRSADISSMAAPILRSEALAAQGAQIDSVSGASTTSRAYAQSLQAALDASHG